MKLALRMVPISKIIINWCHNYLTDTLIGYSWFSFYLLVSERKLFLHSQWGHFGRDCLVNVLKKNNAVRNLKNRLLLAASLERCSGTLHTFENMLYSFILLRWAFRNWFPPIISTWRMACFYWLCEAVHSRDPQLQDGPCFTAAALPLWRLPVAKRRLCLLRIKWTLFGPPSSNLKCVRVQLDIPYQMMI